MIELLNALHYLRTTEKGYYISLDMLVVLLWFMDRYKEGETVVNFGSIRDTFPFTGSDNMLVFLRPLLRDNTGLLGHSSEGYYTTEKGRQYASEIGRALHHLKQCKLKQEKRTKAMLKMGMTENEIKKALRNG